MEIMHILIDVLFVAFMGAALWWIGTEPKAPMKRSLSNQKPARRLP